LSQAARRPSDWLTSLAATLQEDNADLRERNGALQLQLASAAEATEAREALARRQAVQHRREGKAHRKVALQLVTVKQAAASVALSAGAAATSSKLDKPKATPQAAAAAAAAHAAPAVAQLSTPHLRLGGLRSVRVAAAAADSVSSLNRPTHGSDADVLALKDLLAAANKSKSQLRSEVARLQLQVLRACQGGSDNSGGGGGGGSNSPSASRARLQQHEGLEGIMSRLAASEKESFGLREQVTTSFFPLLLSQPVALPPLRPLSTVFILGAAPLSLIVVCNTVLRGLIVVCATTTLFAPGGQAAGRTAPEDGG
jgi:hypothetical protein